MPLTRVAADPWAASHSVPQFSPLPVDTTSQHVPLTAERAEVRRRVAGRLQAYQGWYRRLQLRRSWSLLQRRARGPRGQDTGGMDHGSSKGHAQPALRLGGGAGHPPVSSVRHTVDGHPHVLLPQRPQRPPSSTPLPQCPFLNAPNGPLVNPPGIGSEFTTPPPQPIRAQAVVRTHIERSRPSLDAGALLDEAALAEAAGLLLNPTAPNAMGRTYSTPGRPMGGRGGVSGVGQGLAVHVGPQLHDGYDSGPPTRSPSRRPGPRIGDEEEDEEEEEEAEEDDESDGEGRAAPSPATRARMLDPDLMAAWMRGAQADGAEAGGQGGAAASPGSRARTGQSALARRISCPEALLAEEAEAAAAAAAGGGARPEDALEPLANHHMWMANRGRALGGYDPGAGHTGLLYCAKSVLEAAGGGRRAHLVGDGWQVGRARDRGGALEEGRTEGEAGCRGGMGTG